MKKKKHDHIFFFFKKKLSMVYMYVLSLQVYFCDHRGKKKRLVSPRMLTVVTSEAGLGGQRLLSFFTLYSGFKKRKKKWCN